MKYIELEILTVFLRTLVPVWSPLQGLVTFVRNVKRHPHVFFTFMTKILLVGIQSIEEETIFPVSSVLRPDLAI